METVLASIPLFTLCRPTDCSHGFPIPTYKHYKNLLQVNESTWEQRMVNWSLVYPKWSDKIPKAVWRGGLIGHDKDHRRVLTQKSNIVKNRVFLDVLPVADKCWKAIPLAPKMPETDFMNYRAVLDLDGTAWSERFARLLCYNSVVIRIEVDNDLEEYFYFDDEELQPHVHYLPATLKNGTLVASRAAQNKSRVAMERIIAPTPTPTFGVGPTWSFRNSTKPLRRLWRDTLAIWTRETYRGANTGPTTNTNTSGGKRFPDTEDLPTRSA